MIKDSSRGTRHNAGAMVGRISGSRAAPLGLALLVLTFFAPVLWGRAFFLKDAQLVVYPMRLFLREQLLLLRVPEWLPGLDLGMPFLANPSNGVLYPLNAILLLPAPWCVGVFVVCHSVIAALGALFLLQSLGVRRHPALLGAVGFALGGYLVSLTWVANYMMSLAWLPLVLLFARRALARGRLGDAAVCGVMWALQLLSGEPQGVVMTGWAVFAFAVGYPLPWRLRVRRTLLLVLSLGVALCLAMPQVLPALELIPRSRRAEGIALEEAVHWSFHPLRLFELCVPWLFGNPLEFDRYLGYFMNDEGGRLHRDPWMVTPYFGSLSLLFVCYAAWAPLRRHRHWIRSLGALALVSLLLAFGRHTPLFALFFESVPGATLFRYPAKYFGLCAVLLPLLAAAGADAWLRKRHVTLERVLVAGIGSVLLLGLAVSAPLSEALAALRPELTGDPSATVRSALLYEAATLVVLLSGLVWIRSKRVAWLGPALLAATTVQVVRANLDAYQTAPLSAYREPELARALRAATPSGSAPRVMHDVKSLALPGLDAASPERRARAFSASLMKNTGLAHGVGYARSYASSEEGPKFRFWRDTVPYRRALLDVFGIRHLVLPSDTRFPPQTNLVRLAEFDHVGAAVFENPTALPFAFPVARVVAVNDFDAATRALPDPRIAKGELAVLGPPVVQVSNTEGSGAGRCALRAPLGDVILLDCDLPAPSWVVVNESHHPNWTARVDGEQRELVPANALVMALHVPEGKRRVELRYDEPSFWPGVLVSAFGALLSTLLVLRDRSLRAGTSRASARKNERI